GTLVSGIEYNLMKLLLAAITFEGAKLIFALYISSGYGAVNHNNPFLSSSKLRHYIFNLKQAAKKLLNRFLCCAYVVDDPYNPQIISINNVTTMILSVNYHKVTVLGMKKKENP
ncbi:hypothetical protein ACJX0J_017553, partial [Zea mays]